MWNEKEILRYDAQASRVLRFGARGKGKHLRDRVYIYTMRIRAEINALLRDSREVLLPSEEKRRCVFRLISVCFHAIYTECIIEMSYSYILYICERCVYCILLSCLFLCYYKRDGKFSMRG